ncbi:response regulator [Paenibacillus sp. WQ 127069]|uniref:Response regulator n=1 Tax=Paenibacillus baimaensis TaxID=2982185 RepID=A0ABT2UUV1_9BACL|nr:response regulator [Paenibacillus sp. WQ 127069]MCU6797801.1 response regulator [Paenibacillus sp. WQ 127069]
MKMLIVDDEIQIRTGLQEGMNWKSLGLNEVYIADNGVTALQLFKQHNPEIIITDIRMPRMDGLALIKSVRDLSSSCKFIILSGYSEFEYAKEALQYGVIDYELKPVNIKRLLNLVKKAIETIDKEKSQVTWYHEYWSERLVRDIVSNTFTETPNILELLTLNIKWKPGIPLRICYLQADAVLGDVLTHHQERIQQLLDTEAHKIPGMIHRLSSRDYMLIMNSDNRAFELEKWWKQVQTVLLEHCHISMTIGISNEEGIAHLPRLYEQALEAIQLRLYGGPRTMYYYYEVPDRKEVRSRTYTPPEDELSRGFHEPSFASLQSCINREFDVFLLERNRLLGEVRGICRQYAWIAEQELKRMPGVSIQPNHAEWNRDHSLEQIESIEGFRSYVLQLYRISYEQVQYVQRFPNMKGVAKAISYMHDHFHEDISVKEVAAYIQQSPNYFSHKFKQEMGVSYTAFLNRIRIEEASRQLQAKSTAALYEISWNVGFRDYKYFTQVFKKQKGVSPSEYQRKGLGHPDI